MGRGFYNTLSRIALIIIVVMGVILVKIYVDNARSTREYEYDREQYQYRMDSLKHEHDSLMRESGRLGVEVDSLIQALDRSKRNEQVIGRKYAKLRSDLASSTTDEHIEFLAAQLSL